MVNIIVRYHYYYYYYCRYHCHYFFFLIVSSVSLFLSVFSIIFYQHSYFISFFNFHCVWTCNQDGCTALHLAAENGNLVMVNHLINSNLINFNIKNEVQFYIFCAPSHVMLQSYIFLFFIVIQRPSHIYFKTFVIQRDIS